MSKFNSDDSDIKIAGSKMPDNANEGFGEDMDEVAQLIMREKQNGNITKAKKLGISFVDTIFSDDVFTSGSDDSFFIKQVKMLITFTVDLCMDNGMPNKILSQSAQNIFYEQVRLRDPVFYDEIQTMGAFSMYLLCARSEAANSVAIGEDFAKLCKKENDEECKKLGQKIFEYYLAICREKIKNAGFVK